MRYDFGEVITAMITPFNKDLSIDYKSFGVLIEHLIKTGTESILVAGTTGETPTLTHEEEDEIFEFVKNKVNKRVKLIMGAGSNSTQSAHNLPLISYRSAQGIFDTPLACLATSSSSSCKS